MSPRAQLEPDSAPETGSTPTDSPTGIAHPAHRTRTGHGTRTSRGPRTAGAVPGVAGAVAIAVVAAVALVVGTFATVHILTAGGAPPRSAGPTDPLAAAPDLTPADVPSPSSPTTTSAATAPPGTASRTPSTTISAHASAGTHLSVSATVTVPGSTGALPWPDQGQAALAVEGLGAVTGRGTLGTSGPAATPVPIASVAKVMTAYLVLRHHPLAAGEAGPVITVQAGEAAAYPDQVAQHESLVKVTAGEDLTEEQALQALLLASANNIARILARWDAGTPTAFVARMNRTAADLGMTRTHYTDPAGLDDTTVSTATDQLLLARRALTEPAFAAIVAQPSAVIPVAGTIRNYNSLLGRDGIIGIKTGSTTPAGGCMLVAARHTVAGHTLTIVGAVLGQPGTPSTILPHALAAADTLIRAADTAVHEVILIRAGQAVATRTDVDGTTTDLTVAQDITVTAWPGLRYRLAIVPGKTRPRLRVTGPTTSAVTVSLAPRTS